MNTALYAAIALGGALGALSRYFISTWVYNKCDFAFPWGTFVVNILGCFILGMVFIWGTERAMIGPNMRAFLGVGLLGAFTTFSTFCLETINIIKDGEIKSALLNTVGSVILGLLALWLGTVIAALLSK